MDLTKGLISAAMLWHFGALVLDGLPSSTLLHDRLHDKVMPYLIRTGQWQGGWSLYAPSPDNLNQHIEAKLVYADGTEAHWRSPDWLSLNILEKLQNYRAMNYFDRIRLDSQQPAWEPLASWIKREFDRPTNPVQHLVLSRHWANVPSPPSMSYNEWTVPLAATSIAFYTKDYP